MKSFLNPYPVNPENVYGGRVKRDLLRIEIIRKLLAVLLPVSSGAESGYKSYD
jgi:hypothetical protein